MHVAFIDAGACSYTNSSEVMESKISATLITVICGAQDKHAANRAILACRHTRASAPGASSGKCAYGAFTQWRHGRRLAVPSDDLWKLREDRYR